VSKLGLEVEHAAEEEDADAVAGEEMEPAHRLTVRHGRNSKRWKPHLKN